MTIYVLATIEDQSVLPELISAYVNKSIKFTVGNDIHDLCPCPNARPKCPGGCGSSSTVPQKSSCCSSSSTGESEKELKVPKPECEELEEEDDGPLEMCEGTQSVKEYCQMKLFGAESPDDQMEFDDNNTHPQHPVFRRKLNSKGFSRQCQMCEQWITSKNIRAHAGTHISLCRLKCSCCEKTFARMNRGVHHLKQVHPDDPSAKIISAVTQDQQRALDELMLKCFPPMCYCQDKCLCKC